MGLDEARINGDLLRVKSTGVSFGDDQIHHVAHLISLDVDFWSSGGICQTLYQKLHYAKLWSTSSVLSRVQYNDKYVYNE